MRKIWLHIIIFFVATIGFSQTYDFRNYNVEDGLAQSQVLCIFQDSKGYMWFGTGNGIEEGGTGVTIEYDQGFSSTVFGFKSKEL